MQGKKIFHESIEEGKFYTENNIERGYGNENLSFGTIRNNDWMRHRDFFEDGKILKNGFKLLNWWKSILEIKDAELTDVLGFVDDIDYEKMSFSGKKVYFLEGVLVEEVWDFSYQNAEITLQNGQIIFSKNLSPNMKKYIHKINMKKIFYTLYNFLSKKVLKITVKNGQVDGSSYEEK